MTTFSHNSNTVITKNTCNLPSVPSSGSYRLSILRQHSLEVDTFIENGQQKSVHYVVKSNAFVLEVALQMDRATSGGNPSSELKLFGTAPLDFRRITLEASLLYDCEEDQPVVKVRSRPLTTRGVVNTTNPTTCKLESTIEVLSSQCEDLNFKIKLTAVEIATGKKLESVLPVYSAPIQVISKPAVLVKKKKRTSKTPRNKTKQDQVLEALTRIESKQNTQQNQLDFLIGGGKPPTQSNSLSGHKRTLDEVPSLETAFYQFVNAYDRVRKSERPGKLRKIFANSEPADLSNFVEAAQFLQSNQFAAFSQDSKPLVFSQEPQLPHAQTQDSKPLEFPYDLSLENLLEDLS